MLMNVPASGRRFAHFPQNLRRRAGIIKEVSPAMMNLPSEITICEVGLRDGLQNEKTIVSTEDKLSLLRDLWTPASP